MTGAFSLSPPRGYASGCYAASLAAVGKPRELKHSGAWILERAIPGVTARDGTGCYPLFVVRDWSKLPLDLAEMAGDLISLVVVTDPFGDYDEHLLQACFGDFVFPFKEHYIVDLDEPGRDWISAHHSRNARIGRTGVRVETCADPAEVLDEWVGLYAALVERHAIRGTAAFSREAFALQLRTPGIVALRALRGTETAGILLWYAADDIAYYHLGAYTREGYALRASYALFDYALDYFAGRGTRWLGLGGGAGGSVSESDGLTRFKRGWTNAVRTVYLCGRVFDRDQYERLVAATQTRAHGARYFPLYRAGDTR